MFKKLSLGIFLIFLLNQAFGQAGWWGPYHVNVIEVTDAGIYFGKPSEISAFPNPFNCSNTDWVFCENGTKLADRALSIGLTAQATNRKVNYYISGCSGPYLKASIIQALP